MREEGFDLSQIPTKFDQAIHIDGNYFHRIPHPTVSDLHKVDHKQSQKSLLLDAIIIGMNKNINEERYRYTIFDPLNLVLSHARARPGSPNKIELSYQDSQGTKQSIEKNFSNQDMYEYGNESLFLGWLENTVSSIIEDALI